MSVVSYIPEITRAAVDVAFSNDTTVIATLTPDYEGEAKSGNAVTINGADLPTVQDYAANGRRFTADEIATTVVKVLIDQESIVPQRVDNIDRRQAAGSLDQFTNLQGKALARHAERYVIQKMINEGTAVNAGTIDSGAKAKAAVRKLMTELDKAEVPAEGRFLAINPAMKDLLIDELSDASKSGSTAELRKGQVGELYGFTILATTDFAEKVKPAAVAYHEAAAAYVGQVDESRAVPAQDGHADILSSLLVYGAKVTRPKGVAVIGAVAETPAA